MSIVNGMRMRNYDNRRRFVIALKRSFLSRALDIIPEERAAKDISLPS